MQAVEAGIVAVAAGMVVKFGLVFIFWTSGM